MTTNKKTRINTNQSRVNSLRVKSLCLIITLMVVSGTLGRVLGGLKLSTKFVGVEVNDVKIGKSYSLMEKGKPYTIQNGSEGTVDIVMELQNSAKNLKGGYESIPDLSWIKVIPDRFKVGPHQKHSSNIIISVPDDPNLFGKNFRVFVWARTVSKNFFGAGVRSKLRFSIHDPSPKIKIIEGAESKAHRAWGPVKSLRANGASKGQKILECVTEPQEVYLKGVEIGTAYDVKKQKNISLKIFNQTDIPVRIRLRSIEPTTVHSSQFTVNSLYTPTPEPSWLIIKPKSLKIREHSYREARIFLKIPSAKRRNGDGEKRRDAEEKEYQDKKYCFLIEGTVTPGRLAWFRRSETGPSRAGNVPVTFYTQVYVEIIQTTEGRRQRVN